MQATVYLLSRNRRIEVIRTPQVDTCQFNNHYLRNVWNDIKRKSNDTNWTSCGYEKVINKN